MKDAIIKLIAEVANRGQNDFDVETRLIDELYLSDLDRLELLFAVEEEINRKIDDEAWLCCETVQDVITLAGSMLATH
ncbi:MAG: acyl carrier protein [Planctomycetota bacterium]